MMNTNTLLGKYRKMSGKSQKEFSEALELGAPQYISNIECGRAGLSNKQLFEFARFYKIPFGKIKEAREYELKQDYEKYKNSLVLRGTK